MTQSLLIVAILGLGSSVLTELISWVNAKINGSGFTSLQGKAALLVSIAVAFIAATIQAVASGHFSLSTLGADWSEIFASSQLIFAFIISQLGLTVPALTVSSTSTVV